MSTRSTTPRISCSEPIGISVATTWGPKAAFSDSSVRKKSARSRSSMLTKSIRARSSASARCHRRIALTSAPMTALITKMADSQTRRAPSESAAKMGSPGESMRLIMRASQSHALRGALLDLGRARRGDDGDLVVVTLERAQRRADRHLARLLVGVGIGGRVPIQDRAQPVDGAGLEQQCLVDRGLAAATMADEGDVPDAVRPVHALSPLLE